MFSFFAVSAMLTASAPCQVCLAATATDKIVVSHDAGAQICYGLENACRQHLLNDADWLALSIEKIDYSLIRMELKESRIEIGELRQKMERLKKSPRQ